MQLAATRLVGGGSQEGEYEIPLLTASLVTFCAVRKLPPGGCSLPGPMWAVRPAGRLSERNRRTGAALGAEIGPSGVPARAQRQRVVWGEEPQRSE